MMRQKKHLSPCQIRKGLVNSIKKILYLFFGEWNGLQNLLLPSVFIFWFENVSFVKWIVAILTYQRQYMAIFFYLLLLFYIVFLLVKAAVQWHHIKLYKPIPLKTKLGRDLLIPLLVLIHKWLLVFLTGVMFIYVVKNIYVYMYNAALPLFAIYIIITKVCLVASLLYTYAFLQVSVPLIKRGQTFRRTQAYYHLYLAKRWKKVVIVYFVQAIWIYVSILIFKIFVEQIARFNTGTVMNLFGKPVLVNFPHVEFLHQFFGNTALFIAAFMLSNLLYSPLVLLTRKGFELFKFKLTMV